MKNFFGLGSSSPVANPKELDNNNMTPIKQKYQTDKKKGNVNSEYDPWEVNFIRDTSANTKGLDSIQSSQADSALFRTPTKQQSEASNQQATQQHNTASQFEQEATIQSCWEQFTDFYMLFISDLDYYKQGPDHHKRMTYQKRQEDIENAKFFSLTPKKKMSEEEKHHQLRLESMRNLVNMYNGEITRVPVIQQNIINIVRVLKDDDKDERGQQMMGENLEYFIQNKIIETMAAYAMTDEPQGFFKFMIGGIQDLLKSIQSTCILSHSSVHSSVRQILSIVYDQLNQIPFTDGETSGIRKPIEHFLMTQRPSVGFYTIEILEFINMLNFKVQNNIQLIRLLFCQRDKGMIHRGGGPLMATHDISESLAQIESDDICLPFHILVYYLKNAKYVLSPMEKNFLDDVIVMSFNSLSCDAKFVCYLINESDFIDILMSDIATSLECLPNRIDPKDILGNFNLEQQLMNINPIIVEQQYVDLFSSCRLLGQIYNTLENLAIQFYCRRTIKNEYAYQIKCIQCIQKAILEGFVQIVLIGVIQPSFISKDVNNSAQIERIRTMLQYLIQTIQNISCAAISSVTFAFLSNTISNNFDDYLNQTILKMSQTDPEEEINEDEYVAKKKQDPANFDDSGDIDNQVNGLFPNKDKISRFSVHNPLARFTTNADQMRQTIKNYQMNGRPIIEDEYYDEEDDPQTFTLNQKFIQRLNLVTNPINEELLNFTSNDTFLTCFNIDDLFIQAEKMEQAQNHHDDDFFNQMNLYENIDFKQYFGDKVLHLCFKDFLNRHHNDLSVIMLKQISVLIQTMGPENFVINQISLKQRIMLQEQSDLGLEVRIAKDSGSRNMSLVDYPEMMWMAIDGRDLIKINDNIEIISACSNMKQLIHINFSDDYVVKMKPKTLKNQTNIWIVLLMKLECFTENRPNENIVLCEIILQLLTTFNIDSTQTLQWALCILQLNQPKILDKNKAKSKQWSDKLNKLKQKNGMKKRKLDLTAPVSPTKPQHKQSSRNQDETLNITQMPDNSLINAKKREKQKDLQVSDQKFIIEVINKVKKQIDLLEAEEQNIEIYQKLLLQDVDKDNVKNKKKVKKGVKKAQSEADTGIQITDGSEDNSKTKDPPSSHDTLMEKARLKHEQKCRDELEQPYIFRDKNLVIAENILIFKSFYTSAMRHLATLALSISMVQSTMAEKNIELSQSQPIVCRPEKRQHAPESTNKQLNIHNIYQEVAKPPQRAVAVLEQPQPTSCEDQEIKEVQVEEIDDLQGIRHIITNNRQSIQQDEILKQEKPTPAPEREKITSSPSD